MKVSLFYESKSINRPREEWYGRDVWNTPQTYIRRIYANAVDNPEYPIPLGYWEWTKKQQRPTLRDRWNWITTLSWMVEKGIKIQDAEFYDCTVPAQIAEKILRKLGWEDSSDSDEGDKWWLLIKHTINETEFFGGKTWAAMEAQVEGLPVPSTAEMQEELAKRIYEI